MSRDVRYDGSGALLVRFPFDPELVGRIKTLPSRRWNPGERHWWVPVGNVVRLVELLEPARFAFDAGTREQYRLHGGTRDLADPPRPEAGAAGPADYTVSGLNEQVKAVLEGAFPQPIWLVGEVSGFNRNAHKRHVTFQLVEHGPDGKNVSSIDATLFEQARQKIARALADGGDALRLEDEVTVRLRVRVELHVPWGSYRVVVEELDPLFTLGEAARRREEILRRLAAEGLLERNAALPLPALPLRVGLVTSLHSDAYNDVLRSLQESCFAFSLIAHGARVQGHATEPSVLRALDALARRAADLDAVLICRGGGSRTDLAWFDSLALGRAVAGFPLPVIVGIGHERDFSVLDAVARRAKTPTAAAALLVERVRESVLALEHAGQAVLAAATEQLAERRRHDAAQARRIAQACRARVGRAQDELVYLRRRARRAGWTALAAARERLGRHARSLPRACRLGLARARGALDLLQRALPSRAAQALRRERERADARARRLHLVDPRRVVERGYSILRLDRGRVLTAADQAPAGTRVRAELCCGELDLRSEGRPAGTGGS